MSNEESQEPEDIEVRHTYPDDYELHPITGATGGIQPEGQMKIDFVYDHDYQTTSEYYDPDEGFLTGIKINGHMEREHRVGVSMQPRHARSAAVWILSQTLGENVNRQDIQKALRDLVENTEEE